jgi:hypothetical protein
LWGTITNEPDRGALSIIMNRRERTGFFIESSLLHKRKVIYLASVEKNIQKQNIHG